MRSRIGPTAGLGVVKFETSLRSSEKITPDLVEKERRWSNIPKKDRKGLFTLLAYFINFMFQNFLHFCQNSKMN